jgi:hypothetical protein
LWQDQLQVWCQGIQENDIQLVVIIQNDIGQNGTQQNDIQKKKIEVSGIEQNVIE